MNNNKEALADFRRDNPHACCEKAVRVYCVCRVSYKCPDHGQKCVGSHD